MKHLRRFLPALLLLSLLAGCGGAPGASIVPGAPDTPADYLAGGKLDPETGFSVTVPTQHSQNQLRAASDALLEARVLTQGELSALAPDQAVSRAMFIRLVAGAAKLPLPVQDRSLPGQVWYAPYVQAGYTAGLFPDDGASLSFLPTDGFLQGDEGYLPMLEPISRGDARTILAQLLPGQELLSPLGDGLDHDEGQLSQGDALVCACEVMTQAPKLRPLRPGKALTAEELLRQGSILHAGGYISTWNGRKYSYTNSAEALINSYGLGARLMEFDFSWTSDGHLACVHGWQSELAPTIVAGIPLPLDQWLESRVYGTFTPLCLESLAAFMRQHPDLYVVTDIKDDNVAAAALIARTCPDLRERFLIQIYKDEEYQPVAELGFPHIIFTLYDLSAKQKLDTAHWAEFAAEHPLFCYTFPVALTQRENYTQEMLLTGTPLAIHTVNDPQEIQAAYNAGITAVYTDTPPADS